MEEGMDRYDFIRFETPEEGIAVVTLDRPERLNALNGRTIRELRDAVARIEGDDSIRVWLLTGAPRPDGRPCFGGGVDRKCFSEGLDDGLLDGDRLTNSIEDMLKPSIAVVDGVCSTGSGELALACHLRLVGEQVRVSDWHLKNLGTGLGGWGASTRLARLVGVQKAREIILTGKEVGAEEAIRVGYALAAHPSDGLMEAALEMARTIRGMAPEGVRLTLAHLGQAGDLDRDRALRLAELLPKWLGVDTGVAHKV
ncbi:MAG: enoyl-CoA hydratase/isomerase family protein [Deltaproteobacteria bacterium]|nr:enoyl-CoA hydratase/isomerase family protein [Deltaproteobacteria bacterium]